MIYMLNNRWSTCRERGGHEGSDKQRLQHVFCWLWQQLCHLSSVCTYAPLHAPVISTRQTQ